jgi:poly(3-hydroxybutyrate) depolymerase
MAQRHPATAWARIFQRSFDVMARTSVHAGTLAVTQALKPVLDKRKPSSGAGQWLAGVAMGPAGVRRYRLYRPPAVKFGERLPLMVMLHGCGQDAKGFANSTRMNAVAARERFLVLYPEQDRLSNAQG